MTGTVAFNGAITLGLRLAFNPEDGVDIFRIIVNDGSDLTTLNSAGARFNFGGNSLEDGEVFAAPLVGGGAQFFEMRYGLTATDNDVRLLAVIPEPGPVAHFIGGVGLLSVMFRWRRSGRA